MATDLDRKVSLRGEALRESTLTHKTDLKSDEIADNQTWFMLDVSQAGKSSLTVRVDNRTSSTFSPAGPKSSFIKYGIFLQPAKPGDEVKCINAKTPSPIEAAKIYVEDGHTDGIKAIIAFDCFDDSEDHTVIGRMVLYFCVPDSDSEDNVLKVSFEFRCGKIVELTLSRRSNGSM